MQDLSMTIAQPAWICLAREQFLMLETALSESRLNEFKCAPLGHPWCGSMWDFGEHLCGALEVVDANWRVAAVRNTGERAGDARARVPREAHSATTYPRPFSPRTFK